MPSRRHAPNCLPPSKRVLLHLYQRWCFCNHPSAADGSSSKAANHGSPLSRSTSSFAQAAAHVVQDGFVTTILKQQLREGYGVGCSGHVGSMMELLTGNCASMADKHWISVCVYCCGHRRKACLDGNNAWSKFGTVAGGRQAIPAWMLRRRRAYTTSTAA